MVGRTVAIMAAAMAAAVGGAAPALAACPGWRVTPAPRLANAELWGVAAPAANVAWAVGSRDLTHALIERWDGHRWRRSALPRSLGAESALEDVVAVSTRDAWAVGNTPSAAPSVLHWTGGRWRAEPLGDLAA